MSRAFGPRRAAWVEVDSTDDGIASSESREIMTRFDLIYRSIVATQFNFHQSGHPGGSISVGHVLTALLFGTMDYDLGDPNRHDADLISFAAGHKATGLYGMWALRDEVARLGKPELLLTEDHLRIGN
jgi:transketolase